METFLEFLRFLIWLRGRKFRAMGGLRGHCGVLWYLLLPKGVRGVPRCVPRSMAALWVATIMETLPPRSSKIPKMSLFSI